ncbi:MAG: hypothetical protein O7F71_02105 [Gammaproteobacteria bacterium]|nr:hypothetical protein [Gammaproteobacteria bacterium]
MNTQRSTTQKRSRVTLLLILAVFVLPLALAWIFAKGPLEWRPVETVNNGVLVAPPLLLESFGVMDDSGEAPPVGSIASDWFLVVLRGPACGEQCAHWLEVAERIQLAVGRDMPRVTVVLLGPVGDTPTPLLVKESQQSWQLPPGGKLVSELGRATGEPPPDARLLIVNHQGRVVLAYPTTEDGRGVLDDLKRLLKASSR